MAPRLRLVAVLVAGALLAVALAAAGRSGGAGAMEQQATFARSIDAQPGTALRHERLARSAATWRGGSITTSTGEVVDVFVSDSLPVDTVTPEAWAEFMVSLTHGPELARVTSYMATLAEVQELCGTRALGCYSRDEMVSLGEATIDGTTPEEVVRHEYGHHIALYRENAPWRAIDWGPKHWASAATVCPRVVRGEAFPGNEGRNYSQNPGEAWAEVYRLLEERKAGITTGAWPIIAPSFYPDETALQAAERDVLQPWSAGRTASFKKVFAKKAPRVWWIPFATPLDGNLRIVAALPRGGLHEVALVAGNRRTVIRRGQWVGQRAKRIETTVCGQRALFIRVTQAGALGRVAVTAATP